MRFPEPSLDQMQMLADLVTTSTYRATGGAVQSVSAQMNFPETDNLSVTLTEIATELGSDKVTVEQWHYEIGPDGKLLQEPVKLSS